jgi:hypothetical protein
MAVVLAVAGAIDLQAEEDKKLLKVAFVLPDNAELGSVEAVKTVLVARGRSDLLTCKSKPMACRGAKAAVVEVLQERFLYCATGKRGTWVCLRCSAWQSQTVGVLRPTEHMCFNIHMKEASYKSLHGLDVVEPEMLKLLKDYMKLGSNTAPCKEPLSKEGVMRLVQKGSETALLVAKVNNWVPVGLRLYEAGQQVEAANHPAPSQMLFDLQQAQTLNVIAAVGAAMSFNGVSSPEWQRFFNMISNNSYKAPSRQQAWGVTKKTNKQTASQDQQQRHPQQKSLNKKHAHL